MKALEIVGIAVLANVGVADVSISIKFMKGIPHLQIQQQHINSTII